MNKLKELNVYYHQRPVGQMVLYKNSLAAFEYDDSWLREGFALNPFSLPLVKKVFVPKREPFDGLFGVFADSLPDGWGRLLVDRLLLKNHINPATVTPLERLAIVGSAGMGALTYRPENPLTTQNVSLELDEIARECAQVLQDKPIENLDELFRLGGSSGGARPKIMTTIDNNAWLIKFPSAGDRQDIGLEEYEYSLCARECGIRMMPTKLFPSHNCKGYFGTQRFDRTENGSVHMLSVSAILETSHRIPNLDYDILMLLTLTLSKSFAEIDQLFRIMCFNVFAHNRDDHAKNFSFLFDEKEQCWTLAPAYDLTYSNSLGGEHATTVHGNGQNPGLEDILAVGTKIGMSHMQARKIALEIQECVAARLKKYLGKK